jgi:iron complex outermembrane receptor protein
MALGPAVAGAQTPATPSGGQARTVADGCRFDPRKPKARLSGTVTDSTGATIPAATVTLHCGTFQQVVRTVADGAYRFDVPAGPYQIDVDAPGFQPTAESVDLASPGPHLRNFTLEIGGFESIVTVTAQGGFVAATSTAATKTGAPLIEIAQSVSVVTLDQMKSRNVQTVNEAIQYSASVSVDTYGTESRFDYINIRGFNQSTYGLFRDNSRWQSGTVSGQVDPYLLQEVDIVKGPSSVLYGQNTPGGLVNLVTKRPTRDVQNELIVNYGSHGRKQYQADFAGPLDKAGHWRYRLVGLFRDSDTQVDHVKDDRRMIAPALTWSPSQDTTLTLLADFQRDKTGWGQFLPSQGTFVANPHGTIRRSLFTGEPGYDYFDRDQWSAGSLFEQRFGIFTVRNTLRYSSIHYDGKTVFGGGLQADMRSLNRFGFGNTLDLSLFTTDTHATVRARTGAIEHSLLFGVDYSQSETIQLSSFAFAAPLDVFAPKYGSSVPDLFTYADVRQPLSLLGVYLQDHMKIGKRFVFTLSGRHDWTELTNDDRILKATDKQDVNKASGRVAFTYLSPVGVAPYFSYSTSFMPVGGTDFYGRPFKPTEGIQYEGGLKFQPKNSNSFFTASAFQISQTNVTVPDPEQALNFLQRGEIRSRGIELEAVGNVARGLNFHASYSYLDQEVTETTDATVLGKRPPLAPEQLFGLSGEYTVVGGPFTGLGLGLGARYVGTMAGDAVNSIEVPDYTLIDASARYLWKNVEFQLSATNLADKTYVAICTSPSYCNYGSARKVVGTVRYRFNKW